MVFHTNGDQHSTAGLDHNLLLCLWMDIRLGWGVWAVIHKAAVFVHRSLCGELLLFLFSKHLDLTDLETKWLYHGVVQSG